MTEGPEDATGPNETGSRGSRRRYALIAAGVLVIGTAAALAGVYGIGGDTRNVVAAEGASQSAASSSASGEDTALLCRAASETGARIAEFAKGELAAFAPTLKPTRIPDLAFLDPDGTPTRLSQVGGDGLKLVNIWATWCVPCREEMPALDTLQAELGSRGSQGEGGQGRPGFEVVTVNIDTRDAEKPKRFFEEIGIRNLALFTDPKAKTFQELRAVGRGFGLPTTMLIDANGCEIGHIAGPAEWASPDALALVRAALEDGVPKN